LYRPALVLPANVKLGRSAVPLPAVWEPDDVISPEAVSVEVPVL
jgi:hypothetical protein